MHSFCTIADLVQHVCRVITTHAHTQVLLCREKACAGQLAMATPWPRPLQNTIHSLLVTQMRGLQSGYTPGSQILIHSIDQEQPGLNQRPLACSWTTIKVHSFGFCDTLHS
jgi:hypothetical protein